MPAATWTKGTKRVKGVYTYVRFRDVFIINLFKKCPYSGQGITFEVHGDEPEFNGWKLVPLTNEQRDEQLYKQISKLTNEARGREGGFG